MLRLPAGRVIALRRLMTLAVLTIASIASTAASAAELVMFDGKWCGRCKQFLSEVAPVYHTTPPGKAMPLRVVDVKQTKPWFRISAPIEGTPTFVLVDHGVERGRIVGYTSREEFLQQAYTLMGNLQRRPRAKQPRTRDVHAGVLSAGVVRR
jgi:hypothetical protein